MVGVWLSGNIKQYAWGRNPEQHNNYTASSYEIILCLTIVFSFSDISFSTRPFKSGIAKWGAIRILFQSAGYTLSPTYAELRTNSKTYTILGHLRAILCVLSQNLCISRIILFLKHLNDDMKATDFFHSCLTYIHLHVQVKNTFTINNCMSRKRIIHRRDRHSTESP